MKELTKKLNKEKEEALEAQWEECQRLQGEAVEAACTALRKQLRDEFAVEREQAVAEALKIARVSSPLHSSTGQTTVNRSEVIFMRIGLKIAKKCGLYLDIFSCVKMNVFLSFFAFRLEMHVRCDNQYKTGADRENTLGQPMLFECMGICVLSPAHESEMRGYLVYVLIVTYLSHRF